MQYSLHSEDYHVTLDCRLSVADFTNYMLLMKMQNNATFHICTGTSLFFIPNIKVTAYKTSKLKCILTSMGMPHTQCEECKLLTVAPILHYRAFKGSPEISLVSL